MRTLTPVPMHRTTYRMPATGAGRRGRPSLSGMESPPNMLKYAPMQNPLLRRLFGATIAYTLVGLVGPAVGFVLTPLYVRALGMAGYGTVDLLQTLTHLAYTAAIIGMPMVLASVYVQRADESGRADVIASALAVVVAWAAVVALALSLLAPWLAQLTQRPDTVWLMQIQLLALPFGVVHGTLVGMLRLREAVRLTLVLTLVGVVVTAAVRLSLVVWQAWGIPGMVIAAAATHVVNGIVALWLTRQWWWGRVDWSLMQLLWRRGLPLVPSNIAVWLLLYQDRWLLAGVITPTAQGHYAVAALLVSLLALLIDPFRNAWQPLALSYAGKATAGLFYATSLRVYLAVALLAAMVMGLWAPELLWLFGGIDAQPAARLLWPLLLVPLCSGVMTIVGIVPTIHGKLAMLGWSTAAAALVNTLLNLWFIPHWGAMGAGVATALAALVMPVMIWWQARRMLAVAYAWWLMAGYGVLAVACIVVALWLGGDWGARMGVVVGYVAVVGLCEYRYLWRWRMHA